MAAGAEATGPTLGVRTGPVGARLDPQLPPEPVDLLRGEKRGVVERIAGHFEAPPLHGVGEEDARAVRHGVGLGERRAQRPQVVPTQVGQKGAQLVVGHRCQCRNQLWVVSAEELPGLSSGQVEEMLVLVVGHLVDSVSECGTAGSGEGCIELVSVLHVEDMPAGVREGPLQAAHLDAGHYPVQTLAIEVDNPQDVAKAGQAGLEERLPHVALVQLGVTQESDEARARARREVAVDVASSGSGEQRRRGAQPYRSGREVDPVMILGPRRVRLEALVRTELGELGLVQPPEQVIDGVEYRRGMWFDAHQIVRAEMAEPQRRHDGNHRGARGLVTPDLEAVGVWSIVVGGVDDAGGQPQDPLLHLL